MHDVKTMWTFEINDVWGFREVIFLIVVFAEAWEAGNHCATGGGLVLLTANSLFPYIVPFLLPLRFFNDAVEPLVLEQQQTRSDGHHVLQSCHDVLFGGVLNDCADFCQMTFDLFIFPRDLEPG